MKILIAATYFEPYHSGLSVYAFRLAKGLIALGHEVNVITSQYSVDLPLQENISGITIIRVPVSLHLTKGVIMPSLVKTAQKWVEWADCLNLHLPQFEAFVFSRLARKYHKPILVTYHCDLVMSGGIINRLAGWGTAWLQKQPLRQANIIVQNSMDYAENSAALIPLLSKVMEIQTPISCRKADDAEITNFKNKYGLPFKVPLIGLAGRVATEKGYEYLIAALPEVLNQFPNARVVHAGAWNGVIGEEKYQKKIEDLIAPLGERWKRLGYLSDEEFQAFFGSLDLLVFSSLNATESFGIVQLESLCQGTPVIASDLPGVRQPVMKTGLGKIVPLRDPHALAQSIISVLKSDNLGRVVPEEYLEQFTQENVAMRYESIMRRLCIV